MLVVADLHLEKGSSLRAARLAAAALRHAARRSPRSPRSSRATRPRRVVALGDSFHDRRGPDRLGGPDAGALAAPDGAAGDWIWVSATTIPDLPPAIGGEVVTEMRARAARAAPPSRRSAPRSELAGHLHPGRQGRAARPRRAGAGLPDRRRALRPAGLRRLCGRPQRLRRGLRGRCSRPASRPTSSAATGCSRVARAVLCGD